MRGYCGVSTWNGILNFAITRDGKQKKIQIPNSNGHGTAKLQYVTIEQD